MITVRVSIHSPSILRRNGRCDKIGVDDGAMHELSAEILRLQLHVLHQVGAVYAFGKTREVLHQSSQRELAAGFVAGRPRDGFRLARAA